MSSPFTGCLSESKYPALSLVVYLNEYPALSLGVDSVSVQRFSPSVYLSDCPALLPGVYLSKCPALFTECLSERVSSACTGPFCLHESKHIIIG